MNRVEVLRVLRRLYEARRFSASVIASIAIGVAPIFVAFSLFEAAVLRDMAVKTPDQLLAIQSARNARGKSRTVTRGISFPDYQDVRTALPRDSWKYMTAWKVLDVTASVSGGYQPLRVAVISGDYFPIASARFLRGRAPDDQGGVVVTHGLWRRLAVGSDTTELTIYGQRYRITGVIAAPFRGIYPDEGVDAWIPLGTLPRLNGDLALLTYRELDDLFVVVQPAAQREADVFGPSVAALSRRLSEFHGGGQFGWRLDVTRAQPGIVEHLRTTRGQTALAPVLVLLCVLLIAATNVANLFVVRSAARENEHQVRLALGISRRHLLLLEGLDPLVLGVLGLALGLWLGILGLRYVADLRALARWDLRVTGISVLIACGAALLFASICALMPAMRVRRLRAVDIIHRGYGITSRGVSRLQRSYLIVQFTFALGFTCVAIQLASAVRQQSAVDVGFDTKNLYVITGTTGASSRTADQYLSDFNRVTSAVSTIPGVLAVSASVSEFFVGYRMTARPVSTTPVNARGASATDTPDASMDVVGPGFFATLGLPIRAGREFGEQDRRGDPTRILVNETLAGMIGGDTPPIGKTLYEFGQYPLEIIGVVPNVRTTAAAEVQPVYYRSLSQSPLPSFVLYVRVRAISPAAATAIVSAINGELPESGGRLRMASAEEQRQQRDLPAIAMFWLSTSLAAIAMLIAALGLYSVASFTALARRREHGIRAALGASPRQLATMIFIEGLGWTALAAAISLPFVWVGMRLATALVVGVRAIPVTSAAVLLVAYLVLALLALTWPARRTASVRPAEALRAL